MAQIEPETPEEQTIRDRVEQAQNDARRYLARNLSALLEHAKRDPETGPTGPVSLERATGVGRSTIYRMMKAVEPPKKKGKAERKNNPTLEQIAAVASAYNRAVWDLLNPELDPAAPPARVMSPTVYDKLMQVASPATYDKLMQVADTVRTLNASLGGVDAGSSETGLRSDTEPHTDRKMPSARAPRKSPRRAVRRP